MAYCVVLKKGEEKRVLAGHPWIFANEVLRVEDKGTQGSVARVVTHDGRFVGQGFINHHSKILVRILTLRDEPVDRNFFLERIKKAVAYRRALGQICSRGNGFRVIFAESDGLPGLVADYFDGVLVVQILCFGMEVVKEMLVEILCEVLDPVCIYERSDVSVRLKEGLAEKTGVLYGTLPSEVEITENGLKMKIDIANGQKTGYFLDQRENRQATARYAKGRRVLDLFCNQGGFALCSALGGASEVVAVDSSDTALARVAENARLNGIKVTTKKADVFSYLKTLREGVTTPEHSKFDLIILDPPALTKSVDTVANGIGGYTDLNAQCLRILSSGGFLVTCSCSQHLTLPMFLDMLKESARRANASVRLVEIKTQAPDHAPLLSSEEGLYLKTAILYKN